MVAAPRAVVAGHVPASLPPPALAPLIPPLAVMGMGSWPRPRWMLAAMHDHIEGRLSDEDFAATADDMTTRIQFLLSAIEHARM